MGKTRACVSVCVSARTFCLSALQAGAQLLFRTQSVAMISRGQSQNTKFKAYVILKTEPRFTTILYLVKTHRQLRT